MDIDTSVVHSARRYNYWLGGTDNFPVDRESGDAIAARFPSVPLAARENRAFLRRAVKALSELGVRQFLDIGTGIPSAGNVHEVAPDARVVYVDNDPLVLVHAQRLLTDATTYLEGDFRDPEQILARARETLDFTQPIGLMLVAILHFVKDKDQPHKLISTLLTALPRGSYLAVTNATLDFARPEDAADARRMLGHEMEWRSADELARFFDGLELVEPGIVPVSDWRPEDGVRPDPAEVSSYGAVGRKP
ncbi:SAM-dependent methyltransferase [Cryptosporangium sp. NPDC048952]|uniref:SAM-dependent methyltransferase n=1 Tax=Cryptosporangium sp. NPDC048952 TaxID=3363961 RepID=UPI00371C5F7A